MSPPATEVYPAEIDRIEFRAEPHPADSTFLFASLPRIAHFPTPIHALDGPLPDRRIGNFLAVDRRAGTDMNIVITGDGRFIGAQGLAESAPVTREGLDAMLAVSNSATRSNFNAQRAALGI